MTRPSLASSEGGMSHHTGTWFIRSPSMRRTTIDKTKELILDFRRRAHPLQPLTIKGTVLKRTDNYKFLSLHISESISWAQNAATTAKRAQQRLHFIRVLKQAGLGR